jgi:tetratricopeptide (TPR) repeat protein
MQPGKSDSENVVNPAGNKLNLFKAINALPRPVLLGGLVMVLATLAAYWPVFSAGFIWDDDAYVTQNPLLTAPDGWERIWFSAHHQSQYFPLVFTTLRFEHALWGLDPLGYHVVNVLMHSINALLVWMALKRLALPGAWLAAAIFALHPVQVETVAWITELKNIESTFFYLLALLAWMRFGETNSWRFYALTFFLYVLALFAKTTACTMPAVMLLTLWLQKKPIHLQRMIQVAPFLITGVALGLFSIWWEKHLGNYQPRYGLSFSLLERLLIATQAVWFYAGKLIWPVNLTFSYPRWDLNGGDPWQYLGMMGCVLVVVFLWQWRRTLDRGPAVTVLFFVAVLSPMLGFIPLFTFYYTFVADHYQYLACVGPIALFAGAATHFSEKWRIHPSARHALAFFLLLVLATLTWQQAGAYQNLETLWRDTLAKNPASWLAHTNLGRLLTARGNLVEAEMHYRTALQLKSDNEDVRYDYGNMLVRAGRRDEAVTQYQQALQLNPMDPDVYNNLGVVLYQERRLDEAITCFRTALRYRPDYPDAHFDLGNALFVEHKFDEAVGEYREALRLDPDSVAIRNRLRALGVPTDQ